MRCWRIILIDVIIWFLWRLITFFKLFNMSMISNKDINMLLGSGIPSERCKLIRVSMEKFVLDTMSRPSKRVLVCKFISAAHSLWCFGENMFSMERTHCELNVCKFAISLAKPVLYAVMKAWRALSMVWLIFSCLAHNVGTCLWRNCSGNQRVVPITWMLWACKSECYHIKCSKFHESEDAVYDGDVGWSDDIATVGGLWMKAAQAVYCGIWGTPMSSSGLNLGTVVVI